MASIKDILYWEKYRPTTLNDVIVPSRIKKLLEKGVMTNMIFTGSPGCGKTTCAKILLADVPHLTLSAKLGVEVLRTEVDKFCRGMIPFEDPNKLRVVYFEEFDTATKALQEELKSFIEQHSARVRFLATCNNISALSDPIQSRFNIVDFTPAGQAETNELKIAYHARITSILTSEKIDMPKDILVAILRKRFPDFRKIWSDIQYFALTGINNTVVSNVGEEKLFEIIFNTTSTTETWDYLYANWVDKIPVAFQKLGRDFFLWVKENKPDYVNKLADIVITVSEYGDVRLPKSMDQFVTLCALVSKLQQLLKK